MSTSVLRHVWPVLCPILVLGAIGAGYLADRVTGWVHSSAQEPRIEEADEQPTEASLLKQLANVPEVGLPAGSRSVLRREKNSLSRGGEVTPLSTQQETWRVLGLTVRTNEKCRLELGEARLMGRLSTRIRANQWVSLPDRRGQIVPPVNEATRVGLYPSPFAELVGDTRLSAVPTFMQMLQPESEATRMMLVEALGSLRDPLAAPALARCAVFDLSPQVRNLAVRELKVKEPERGRQVLLDSFRHPWAPAAEHAADTLIALEDRNAVPALEKLLSQPDPSAPVDRDGAPMVRELVRVNHLKNCLLCHAPSQSQSDLVGGPVPSPDEALPVEYYRGRRPSSDDFFVRADVTYLRQDFSVMLPVKDAAPWPEIQRFDFLVRTRPATAEELAAMKTNGKRSPQREAILRALRELKQTKQ